MATFLGKEFQHVAQSGQLDAATQMSGQDLCEDLADVPAHHEVFPSTSSISGPQHFDLCGQDLHSDTNPGLGQQEEDDEFSFWRCDEGYQL